MRSPTGARSGERCSCSIPGPVVLSQRSGKLSWSPSTLGEVIGERSLVRKRSWMSEGPFTSFGSGSRSTKRARSALGYAGAPCPKASARSLFVPFAPLVKGGSAGLSIESRISLAMQSAPHTASAGMPEHAMVACASPTSHCSPDWSCPSPQQAGGLKRLTWIETSIGS